MAAIPRDATLDVGLSWDRFEGVAAVDVDCACSVFDGLGLMLDCCYYNNLVAAVGALRHSGDSLDGSADGYDEAINVQLGLLPPHIMALCFTVHCFEHGDFSAVETANVRVTSGSAVVAQAALGGFGSNTTALVLTLARTRDGGWSATFPQAVMAAQPVRDPMSALNMMLDSIHVDPSLRAELQASQPKLKLTKNSTMLVPCNLEQVRVGLGWDSRCDVDSGVIAVDADAQLLSTVYFGHRDDFDGAIHHNGDNTTGVGSGDDETIMIGLARLPPKVAFVFVVVNVFTSSKSFKDVDGEYCRLVDCSPGRDIEMCRVDKLDSGNKNGFVFAVLHRHPKTYGFWVYEPIGLHAAGNRCTDLVDECQDWIKQRGIRPALPRGPGSASRGVDVEVGSWGVGKRTIRILRAHNLTACDIGGTSDPYVKIVVNGNPVYKTPAIDSTLNPVWTDARATFLGAVSQTVAFEVWDKDLTYDDKIGVATIADLATAIQQNGGRELSLPVIGPKGQDAGTLVVTMEQIV